jgi:VIT1/CCC1 family predicted Fe2+/Mn2+ transporter
VATSAIVLTGLAGLVAGAFSMGTGEYVSVTNQNELVAAEVAVERDMHARFPEAEREELADRFCSYGADLDTAVRMAAAVSEDPELALQLHAREELGVNPNELPSPLLAGAILPLLPYLFGVRTLVVPLAVAGVALLAGGMVVGWLTGRPLLRSGLRQLALGALAVIVTFGIGHLIGGGVV